MTVTLRVTCTRPASDDDHAVLAPRGILDLDSADLLLGAGNELLDQGHVHLAVLAAGIDFCDSVGLSTLLRLDRRARGAGGWLVLVGVRESLAHLLDLTGLEHVLRVVPAVADLPAPGERAAGADYGAS